MEKKKPILSLYLTKQHLEDTVRQPRSEVFIFVFSRESFYLITVMTRVFSHCMVAQTCEFILRQLQPSVVWAHTHTHTLRISLSMKDNIFPHHQQEINGELSFLLKARASSLQCNFCSRSCWENTATETPVLLYQINAATFHCALPPDCMTRWEGYLHRLRVP